MISEKLIIELAKIHNFQYKLHSYAWHDEIIAFANALQAEWIKQSKLVLIGVFDGKEIQNYEDFNKLQTGDFIYCLKIKAPPNEEVK